MRRHILRGTLLLALVFLVLAALLLLAVSSIVDRAAARLMEETALPLGRELAASISQPLLQDLLRGSVSARQAAMDDVRQLTGRSEAIEAVLLVGSDGAVVAAEPATASPLRLPPPLELFAEDLRPRFLADGGGLLGSARFSLEMPLVSGGEPVAYLLLDLDERALAPLYGPLRSWLLALVAIGIGTIVGGGMILDARLRRREAFLIRTLENAMSGDVTAFAATTTGGFTDVFRAVGRLGHELDDQRQRGARARRLAVDLADLLGSGVILLDGRGEVSSYSRTAAHLLGVESSTEIRERWRALKPHLGGLAELAGEGPAAPVRADVEAGEVEGERRLRLIARRLAESGEEDRVVVEVEDLDQRDAARETLLLADQLRSLAAVRRSIGHDIKGSLNTIGLHLELLRRSLGKEMTEREVEKRRSLLRVIDDELKELLASLERFLDQAAPTAADVVTFDLSDVLRELGVLLRTQARRQNVSLEIQLDEDELLVEGSRSRLRQALLALAIHGLNVTAEATPRTDGSSHHLALSAHRGEGEIVVRVSDRGRALSTEEQQSIFTTGNTNHERHGDLCVCQSLIAEHGGSIVIASSDPEGTTFEVRLPTAR